MLDAQPISDADKVRRDCAHCLSEIALMAFAFALPAGLAAGEPGRLGVCR